MQAVLLDKATLAPDDLELDAWYALPILWREYDNTHPQQLHSRIHDSDVLLTNKVVIDAQAIANAPRLKLIIALATGVDHIDIAAAKSRDIMVCNMIDYCTESVAQHVLAVMLMMATRIPTYQQAIAEQQWQQSEFFGMLSFSVTELNERRLGLLGFGAIARRVAQLADAFGMHFDVAQSLREPESTHFMWRGEKRQRLELEQLLCTSDVLSIHCPLNAQTRNLIDAQKIAIMPKGSWLINTARGSIVNEEAVIEALKSGHLGAAAFDVLSQEPPLAGHVMLAGDIPNLILTPHSAWSSRRARQTLVFQVQRILEQFLTTARVDIARIV